MGRPVTIMRPEEQPRIRRGHVPLSTRVRHVLTALDTLKAKGVFEYSVSQIAAEIDQRMSPSIIHSAVMQLVEHKVLECSTPSRRTYRRYSVADWSKVDAFRRALEDGAVEVKAAKPAESWTAASVKDMGLMRRIWARLFPDRSPITLDRRLSAVEAGLIKLDAKLTDLIRELGG